MQKWHDPSIIHLLEQHHTPLLHCMNWRWQFFAFTVCIWFNSSLSLSYWCMLDSWTFQLSFSHLKPLQAPKQVFSLKRLLYGQPKASHYVLCKGQANPSIVHEIATIWKLGEFALIRVSFVTNQQVFIWLQFHVQCRNLLALCTNLSKRL